MPTTLIKTPTPRNKNEGGYNLEAVKPAEHGSRYATRQNFEGHPTRPEASVAQAYAELVRARIEQQKPLAPQPKIVELHFISRDQASQIVRVSRGKVKQVPTLAVTRSGRFTKPKEASTQLLDRLFLEPELDVRDEAIWDALEEAIKELAPRDGNTIRSLNDSVALLVCSRAGIKIDRSELPSPGREH